MTRLRLALLATTTLTAMQFASFALHAQSAPPTAQSEKEKEEKEKKGLPKGGQPPAKEAPKEAPKAPPTPPAAAPQRPTPPAPPAAAPPRPTPPAPPAAKEAPREAPREAPKELPKGPPAGAPQRPTPPTPPAAAPPERPTPPAGAKEAPKETPRENLHEAPREAPKGPPGAPQRPTAPTPPAAAQPERPVTPPAGTPGRPTAPQQPGAAAPQGRPAPGTAPTPPAAGAPPAPGQQGAAPGGAAFTRRAPPTVAAPLPVVAPPAQALTPIAPGARPPGPQRLEDFRSQRREVQEGGRTVITEPGRIIVRDPSGQEFVRHDEMERFRFGARDIRTERVGNNNQTIIYRPDGTQIITIVGPDGVLLRRIRRDPQGREIVIIDNYRDPNAVGGFYVDLPPPVVRIPYDRYIVDSEGAPPDLIYDTLEAPPVDPVARRYSLDEIRYSPGVRMLMPSIDLNTINFDTGSWEIGPDQAAKLQVIADGLNRAIARNPSEVFLIEGHTDAVGNDVDNLSLSDRRAESAAELLTQQFNVPAENLTSQGYGSQYLKEQTDGPSRINRRVTVRRITPLLNGGAQPR
jgi:outer membrane protein OmpA-like peptidoglycan-associated protein